MVFHLKQDTKTGKVCSESSVSVRFFYAQPFTHGGELQEVGVRGLAGLLKGEWRPPAVPAGLRMLCLADRRLRHHPTPHTHTHTLTATITPPLITPLFSKHTPLLVPPKQNIVVKMRTLAGPQPGSQLAYTHRLGEAK